MKIFNFYANLSRFDSKPISDLWVRVKTDVPTIDTFDSLLEEMYDDMLRLGDYHQCCI